MDNLSLILIAYVALTAWEVWLFVAQRAALQFCRKIDIETNYRWLMLPSWYLMTVWPTKIIRWILLYFMYQQAGLTIAILALVAPWIFNTLVPIPYLLFLRKFEKVLLQSFTSGEPYVTMHAGLQWIREEAGSSASE